MALTRKLPPLTKGTELLIYFPRRKKYITIKLTTDAQQDEGGTFIYYSAEELKPLQSRVYLKDLTYSPVH